MSKRPWLFPLVAALGICTVLLGVYLGYRKYLWINNSMSAVGVVVENISVESPDPLSAYNAHVGYAPKVQFWTATGQQITFVSNLWSTPPPPMQ
jgi:hypothetical protein